MPEHSTHTGLVAPRHVGSSRITEHTCVSHIGRLIEPLSHQGSLCIDWLFFFFNLFSFIMASHILTSKYLFYIWLGWILVCTGFLWLWQVGAALTAVVSLVVEPGAVERAGFSSCGAHLVPLWCVGSSWVRDGSCVPCIGRWILNHWTTREILY